MKDGEVILNYRMAQVTEVILQDSRITKVSTAVNRVARQSGWSSDEALAIRAAVIEGIKQAKEVNRQGKFLSCYKALTERLETRANISQKYSR